MTRQELIAKGWTPAPCGRWQLGAAQAVPLYEGKMVQMFDHRAADVVLHAENLHRAAQPQAIQAALKAQPDRYPTPQYWVLASQTQANPLGWALGYKEISAPTNARTMIATFLPGVGFGNKVPLLIPDFASPALAADAMALLGANFNSLVFDFVLRQKLQGQTINLFILEQLPVITPQRFEQTIGSVPIADFIREQVLHLSYTAHDLAPFARDLGWVDGQGQVKPPFVWHAEDRRCRLAALDGLFCHLYGLSDADAAHMLASFAIVREQDIAAFGRFRTQDDVLAQLRAIRSGRLVVGAGP